MYFDVRAARALQPGEHLVVDGCPGLRLVASSKWASWVYRYKDGGGRMKQTRFGRWPTMPVGAAVAHWQTLRDGKAAGADPVTARRAAKATPAPAAAVTVRQIVQDYLTEVLATTRSASSLVSARRALERLLDEEPHFAALRPGEVTRAQAFSLLQARIQTPTSTAKLRGLMGAAWEHALDAGRMDEDTPNWWRQIMHGKLRSKGKIVNGKHQGRTHVVLTLPQVGLILRWGQEHLLEHVFDVLVMCLWTGARGVEILRIRPEHVTLEGRVLWATLPKRLTKNAKIERAVDLRIPLIGRARRVVQRRIKAMAAEQSAGLPGVMWPNADGHEYTQKDFSTRIYDLMPGTVKGERSRSGTWPVKDWTPHRLRATARTLLAALGCPKEIGDAILGHLPPEFEGTYNRHSYDAERVLWLGRLAKALEAAAAPLRP